ncbi:MAG: type II toxin-antitoxin system RelE/ParE family toxin [Gammaproteobacteria bacterium SHHR-1]|uniref:type II toxin-antitoxin system RelE/ParE family toxin n=1 Tax=Magnetovirga frankeli TaxID=947516 RepID=UPI00129397B8|nr:type II toxin-antitoxin system RelE/ParE family toxin [gamma proteobacterium SS-5]
MARLRWTREAEQWLHDIFDYIAQDNPVAAARVVRGIYDKAQVLIDFPDIGYRYRAEKEGEIRVLLYGHYRIAYLRREDSKWIDVLGVFHGALDIDRYFP